MSTEHELFSPLVHSLTRPSLAMTPDIEPGRIQVSAGCSWRRARPASWQSSAAAVASSCSWKRRS